MAARLVLGGLSGLLVFGAPGALAEASAAASPSVAPPSAASTWVCDGVPDDWTAVGLTVRNTSVSGLGPRLYFVEFQTPQGDTSLVPLRDCRRT